MRNETKNIFSERLKFLIKEKGTTQTEVADGIGILKQSLSYYVNARRVPDITVLKKMCEYFNVSADYFIGTNKEMVFLENKIDELEQKLTSIKMIIESEVTE